MVIYAQCVLWNYNSSFQDLHNMLAVSLSPTSTGQLTTSQPTTPSNSRPPTTQVIPAEGPSLSKRFKYSRTYFYATKRKLIYTYSQILWTRVAGQFSITISCVPLGGRFGWWSGQKIAIVTCSVKTCTLWKVWDETTCHISLLSPGHSNRSSCCQDTVTAGNAHGVCEMINSCFSHSKYCQVISLVSG